MTTNIGERPMTNEERVRLYALLDQFGGWRKRLWVTIGSGALTFALSMLAYVVAWRIVSWLVGLVSDIDLWRGGTASQGILVVGLLASVAYAVSSGMRWYKRFDDLRPSIRSDLANEMVLQEELEFTGAKGMQEQEHGGLIYFLNTSDDRVFVFYDQESQDLGVQGENPKNSSFKPRATLTTVRAPESGLLIDRMFSGDDLDAGDILDLMASPDEWPEDEEFCDIPWDKLEQRLSG